jgi:poly-gamma-glutamate synthesis protein (capsule biosynthesis protein)
MKNRVHILLFIAISILSYYYFSSYSIKRITEKVFLQEDTLRIAKINIVGDLMCHSVQFNYAHVENDSFDFNGVFDQVKEYLSSADFTIGNLETVLAGKENKYSGYPYFNAPDDFLFAIKDAGFDLLITANNHAIDQGAEGVERTINKMNELEINHTGTFSSQVDRDSIRIYNINGIHLAVIAYSYSTNGIPIPEGKDYIINLIKYDLIKSDIIKAKENAEIVLVFYHFGAEYIREPNIYQKDIVNKTIEAGADIIIGSHPHVVQPVEYYKTNNGNLDTGFVAYSLGNFLSNQRWRYSDAGVVLSIEFSKIVESDSVYLSNVTYLPSWVYKGRIRNGREYIILPATIPVNDSAYSYLSKTDKKKMQQAFEDTKEIINRYNSSINLISP